MSITYPSFPWAVAILAPLTEFEVALCSHFYLYLVFTIFLISFAYAYHIPFPVAPTKRFVKKAETSGFEKTGAAVKQAIPSPTKHKSNQSTAGYTVNFYLSFLASIVTVGMCLFSSGLINRIDALIYMGEAPFLTVVFELMLFILCLWLLALAKKAKLLPILQAFSLICNSVIILVLALIGVKITVLALLMSNLIVSIACCCLVQSSNSQVKAIIHRFSDSIVGLNLFKDCRPFAAASISVNGSPTISYRNYLLSFYGFLAFNKSLLWLITYNHLVKPLNVSPGWGYLFMISVTFMWVFLTYRYMVNSIQYVNNAKVDTLGTPFPTDFFILYLLLLKPFMQIIAASWLSNSTKYNRNASGFRQLIVCTFLNPILTALLEDPSSLSYIIPSKSEIAFKYANLGIALMGVINFSEWYKNACESQVYNQTMGQLAGVENSVGTIAAQDPKNPALQQACSDFKDNKLKAEYAVSKVQRDDNVLGATTSLARIAELRRGCVAPNSSSREGIYDCVKNIANYKK